MRKGLLLLNNQIEDIEALATRALLVRVGYEIDTFTLEQSKSLKTAYGLDIQADFLIKELNLNNYDFIVLPGGKHVFNFINNSVELDKVINSFNNENKLIAAICAAPLFLNNLEILKNRDYVVFHGLEDQINGNFLEEAKVVTTDNIITARSAGVVYDFVFEILKYYNDFTRLTSLKHDIIY